VSIETLRQRDLYPAKGSITRLVFTGRGPARALHPTVIYDDPSAAEHAAQEAAAQAAAEAAGGPAAGPWAGTSAATPSPLPPTEAPMGSSEEPALAGVGG
jgi:hypothetical protein